MCSKAACLAAFAGLAFAHSASAGFLVSGQLTPNAFPGRDQIDLYVRNTGGGTGTQLKALNAFGLTLDGNAKLYVRVDDLTDPTGEGEPDGIPETFKPFNDGALVTAGLSSVRTSATPANNVYIPQIQIIQPHPYVDGVTSIAYPTMANTGVTLANSGLGFRFARLYITAGADGTLTADFAGEIGPHTPFGPVRLSALTGITPEPASLGVLAALGAVAVRRRKA